MDLKGNIDLKDLWHNFKSIFSTPARAEHKIEPVKYQDGLLWFKGPPGIKLGKMKAYAPAKTGFMEVGFDLLSYDEDLELYRCKLNDEQFTLDAMQVERRKEFRLDKAIAVSSKELEYNKAQTEDLSLNGCRLRLEKPIEKGEFIGITLHFKTAACPDLSLRAEVRWCAETQRGRYHAGLRFSSITKAEKGAIKRYIQNAVAMGTKP